MKAITKFVSEDGKEFDSHTECEEYESKLFSEKKLTGLSCYNHTESCIVIEDLEDLETFLEESRSWLEPMLYDLWHGY